MSGEQSTKCQAAAVKSVPCVVVNPPHCLATKKRGAGCTQLAPLRLPTRLGKNFLPSEALFFALLAFPFADPGKISLQ
jgi:hypothetical protein